jgi:cellobiose phosphorylase
LSADWNDCIRLGQQGESIFVAFQLRYALQVYLEICQLLAVKEEERWAAGELARLDARLEEDAWDGEWYLRAFRADSFKFGSKESEEGKIFLNPQSWALISGHAESERAARTMQSVRERLATEFGLMICDPPYIDTDFHVMRAALFNAGLKENASIFTHTQGWAVMAETLLGHGDLAYEYFRAYLPAAYNTRAEVREIEPYVYCQFTHSRYSPRFGASRVPWLSGSAAWSFFAATQYILGLQPQYDGIRIDPCIPSAWKEFKMTRVFRGKKLSIEVKNPSGAQKGVTKLLLNGKQMEGNLIPSEELLAENRVEVEMG